MRINRILILITNFFGRLHFSQHGEDVVIHKLFDKKLNNGFYIDIGAHHPFRQSNTAYLWLKGWNGINVDASQVSIEKFNKIRKKDTNLWAAIVDTETAKSQKTIALNFNPNVKFDLGATCDPETVSERRNVVTKSIDVPCDSLENILNKYAPKNTKEFHLLNIDIEGFDEKAISGIASWKSKPQVICIEITKAHTAREILASQTNTILENNGYDLVGKTGISSIYQLRNLAKD